jgi:hypothetical protein
MFYDYLLRMFNIIFMLFIEITFSVGGVGSDKNSFRVFFPQVPTVLVLWEILGI